ncbi:hypothetical protein [Ensifer adhaerens]|uniref:hypothetical protein n=1 Tax=Ensifer adhaerens TaxID=106592 RepID=UPI001CC0E6AB|nr:hypothetical protein [Ensifer adhaerens]MBZ7927514.1 hypothetical protein [Ensifer adhaerens]
MNKLLSAFAAVGLAASSALPLSAAPMFVPQSEQVQNSPVEQVTHRSHRHWHSDRQWDHRWHRRYAHRDCRYYGRCYPRHYGYYNGYRDRGYYGYRDNYRYHRRSGASVYMEF